MSTELEMPPVPGPAEERWHAMLYRRLRSPSFSRNVAETFGTRVFLLGLSVVASVILARILGPAGRGYYAVATAVTGTGVQVGNLGLHASNTYTAARDPSLVPRLFANSLVVAFGAGGAGAAVAFAFLFLRSDLAPVYGWVMVLSVAAIPFALGYLLFQSLLLGIHEVRAYNKIDATVTLLGVALIVGIVVAGAVSVEALMASALGVAVVSCAWAAARVRRHVAALEAPSWPLFRTTFRYGTKAYVAALFAYLVQRADLFILTRMLGSDDTGYYAAAVSVTSVAAIFPSAVGTILFPRLSVEADGAERWRLTRRVLGIVVVGMAAIAALTMILAPLVVRFLFGDAFLPAVEPLRWLMPGVLMLSVNSILMNYFASMGMPMVTVYSPALATVVNVGLNLLLIPRFGVVGAALASVAAYGTMLACSVAYLTVWPRWRSR